MSKFQQDLVKILLDKLILASVVAVFGYYLSRLLENHRNQNAYRLGLLEQHREACRMLTTIFAEHNQHIQNLLEAVELIMAKHTRGEEITDSDLRSGYDYIKHYKAVRAKIDPLLILLPDRVGHACVAYLEESVKVTDVLKSNFETALPTQETINTAYSKFLEACYTAIVYDPFAPRPGSDTSLSPEMELTGLARWVFIAQTRCYAWVKKFFSGAAG